MIIVRNIALFIALLAIKCRGDDIYVASTGGSTSTSCGSSSSPCSTLGAAYSSTKLTTGSTILLSSGEHTASAVKKAGTSSNSFSITIQSANKETPAVLKVSSSITVFTLSYSTLTVKDFSIAVTADTNCLFRANDSNNYLTIDCMNIYGEGGQKSITYLLYVYDYLQEFTCKNCQISNFSSAYALFPMCYVYTTGTSSTYIAYKVSVQDSQFEDITTSTSYQLGGGVFYFPSTHTSLTLSGLSFARCTSNSDGGAIYSAYAGMTITSSSFVNCTANNGGAIYWAPSTSPTASTPYFSSVTFCNNAASSSTGHDVYVSGISLSSSAFSGCTSYTQMTSSLVYINNMNQDGFITVSQEACPCEYDSTSSACSSSGGGEGEDDSGGGVSVTDNDLCKDCVSDDNGGGVRNSIYVRIMYGGEYLF